MTVIGGSGESDTTLGGLGLKLVWKLGPLNLEGGSCTGLGTNPNCWSDVKEPCGNRVSLKSC